METIVFLDLEETVIDTWHEGNFLEVGLSRTRKFLNRLKKDGFDVKIGLMSWAVWNEEDKLKFNKVFREVLEAELDHKFDDKMVWSMDDWAGQIFKACGKKISRQDIFDLFGKEEILFRLCRDHHWANTRLFLVDDRVSHGMSVVCHENNCHVFFLNINDMSD